ncbi:MAG: Gfo/Idh/MocA family oxidoreductase [Bdellovibrionaceae bacterium]|jgi:predicted dehydrogenase|nr:Gfo/Idh/MocA family oxidoreductase [Pseudobdellovibrionaceae bacterium]
MSVLPKTAVVGVGKLGFFHAQKHLRAQKEGVLDFVGFFDVSPERATWVQQELSKDPAYKGHIFENLEHLASHVQAVTIATKSSTHEELTQFFLKRGIHVLVEKPLALSSSGGEELLTLARTQGLKLAVGHSERYQALLPEVMPWLRWWHIRHVEIMRQSAFDSRVSDVSVVDDLMIHDLDLWYHVMGYQGDFVHWQALGRKVLSAQWDEVEALGSYQHPHSQEMIRVRFQASRVLPLGMRMWWVQADEGSLLIDWQKSAWAFDVYSASSLGVPAESQRGLTDRTQNHPNSPLRTWIEKEKQDHLWLETKDFVQALQAPSGTSDAQDSIPLAWAHQVLPSLKWRDRIHQHLHTLPSSN